MTGDRVCRELLENPLTARIPVLMMSGHLTELARTSEQYGNVALALAKPFLSGALINAVETLLAAGPLPKSARQASAPEPASPRPPNGHEANGHAVRSATAQPEPSPPQPNPPLAIPVQPPSAPAESVQPAARESPPPKTPSVEQPPDRPRPTPQFARSTSPATSGRTALRVTMTVEIVAVQVTSSFEMETAMMQPSGRIVSVQIGDDTQPNSVPLETGFRLGEATLGRGRQIETMRLLPTNQPPQLPGPRSLLSVAASRFGEDATNAGKLRLAASPEQAMPVRFTANFQVVAIELSDAFEVAALLLHADRGPVLLRNDNESGGRAFTIEQVQLDAANELKTLLARVVADR